MHDYVRAKHIAKEFKLFSSIAIPLWSVYVCVSLSDSQTKVKTMFEIVRWSLGELKIRLLNKSACSLCGC